MSIKHNSYPGGVPMVQIDGGKIRSLREEKGLTQLYLATSVEVTTDTISRWENRRYPTIKKENALKLAEALEVDLEEILDDDHHKADQKDDQEVEDTGSLQTPVSAAEPKKENSLGRIAFTAVFVGVLAVWAITRFSSGQIEAVRLMPAHTAPGQPFPVVIKILSSEPKPSPFVLREMLPNGAILVESQKSLPAAVDHKTGEMKWISKVTEKMVLGYSLSYKGKPALEGLDLQGTVTLRKFAGSGKAISGNNHIEFAPFHWADSNRDNYIDDLEILAVYEDYSDATGLDLEMDLIEDIWFGNGYEWDSAKMKFEIIP